MKTQIILCTMMFVIGFGLEDSYGQQELAPQEDPSLPLISLQLQLRDSEGRLITYIEPSTLYIRNVAWVHEYLDTIENKTIIEKDGEFFEQIQYKTKATFSSTQQIATYGMVHRNTHVLLFRHDGYITSPGDTLDISWKIIRTIK